MILLPPHHNSGGKDDDDNFRKSAYERAVENLDMRKDEEKPIKLFSGRPKRDEPITDCEVTDLVIELNTKSKTVDEFLERI